MLAAGVMAATSVLLGQGKPDDYIYHHDALEQSLESQKLASPALPPVMHFCAQHCATFSLVNGRYIMSGGGAHNPGTTVTITVESFTPKSVIFHRVDTGPFPGKADYNAPMEAGNSSVSGQSWRFTWGDKLSDLPGTDEERRERAGLPTAADWAAMNQRNADFSLLEFLFSAFSSGSYGSGGSYARAKERCVGKGDFNACQDMRSLRQSLYDRGIDPDK
jgi:hypothetical protein